MAADPGTRKWWSFCSHCQKPLDTRSEGEWWSSREEVCHCN
ncbi:MAG: L-rhamnose mutarotase [bacterium]